MAITKTCKILGWNQLLSVDEGLRRTAENFMRGGIEVAGNRHFVNLTVEKRKA